MALSSGPKAGRGLGRGLQGLPEAGLPAAGLRVAPSPFGAEQKMPVSSLRAAVGTSMTPAAHVPATWQPRRPPSVPETELRHDRAGLSRARLAAVALLVPAGSAPRGETRRLLPAEDVCFPPQGVVSLKPVKPSSVPFLAQSW